MKGLIMDDPDNGLFSATAVNTITTQLSSGQNINFIHKVFQCAPRNCPIHNPSEHEYRDLPLFFTGIHMVRLVDATDENPIGQIIDPDDYEYNRSGKAILRNSAFCDNCEEEVLSSSRHDFRSCSCGAISVDGGSAYLKRSLTGDSDFKDTSIVVKNPDFEAAN